MSEQAHIVARYLARLMQMVNNYTPCAASSGGGIWPYYTCNISSLPLKYHLQSSMHPMSRSEYSVTHPRTPGSQELAIYNLLCQCHSIRTQLYPDGYQKEYMGGGGGGSFITLLEICCITYKGSCSALHCHITRRL